MSNISSTTLLRSRKVATNSVSSNGKWQFNPTLPLHTTSMPSSSSSSSSSLLPSSRLFLPRVRSNRGWGWTTMLCMVALFSVLLVGSSCYHLHSSDHSSRIPHGTPNEHHLSTHNQQDSRALEHQKRASKHQSVKIDGPVHDIAIVGAGPAGLTAALFGARAGLDVIVMGSETGLLSETQHLDNFPSFSGGDGPSWLQATKKQALKFGAKFATPGILAKEMIVPIETGGAFTIFTTASQTKEKQIHAFSVIAATGATPRHLGLPNENLLWGKTLHNCAICDGHLYLDKTVVVVGGGDSALDAAILLARYAKHVVIVHRRRTFSGKNQVAVEVAQSTPNIEILKPYTVQAWEIDSEKQLIGARIQNTEDGDGDEEKIIVIDGSFVMIGATPNTEWLKGTVNLNGEGLVVLKNAATKTSVSGVFAIGEVADSLYKQAITASAAGAEAAIDSERWLRETRGVHKHVAIPTDPMSTESYIQKDSGDEGTLIDRTEEQCDLTKKDCITKLVGKYPVIIFSKSWCPYCRKALEALSVAGVSEPYVVDLTQKKETRDIQDTLKLMTGRRTVPNVFIGGISIGGGDEIVALQAQGNLVALLERSGVLPMAGENAAGTAEPCALIERTCIEEVIHKYPVVMFSLAWCPECKRLLELFASIGAEKPHIVDLDDYKQISEDIRRHMMEISGRRSVPNLFIGGEYFGGFKQTTKMHEEGNLVPKLQEVSWPMTKLS